MIIYNRDKEGNIDKSSSTYVANQKVIDNAIKEFLEGSETQLVLTKMGDQIEVNVSDILINMMATTEVFEMILMLSPETLQNKTAKIECPIITPIYILFPPYIKIEGCKNPSTS